jgi:hypothetical protein
LFVRTLSNLRPLDYPLPERVLLFTMKPPPEIYGFAKDRLMIAELLRRVSAIPGVQSAAIGEAGPLASRQWTDPVRVAGQEPVQAATDQATSGFFAAIGLPLIAGRDFRASDTPAAPRVAIINQKLARELFRNENPIGRVLEMPPLGAPLPPGPRTCEIIGVVGDSHYHDLRIDPGPVVWLAFQDYPPYLSTLYVRLSTLGTFEGVAAIRREFDAVDRDVPISTIRTAGRTDRRFLEPRAHGGPAFRRVRRGGAVAGSHRTVRHSVVLGGKPPARNRHSHGAGIQFLRRDRADSPRNTGDRSDRQHRRNRRGDCRGKTCDFAPCRRIDA